MMGALSTILTGLAVVGGVATYQNVQNQQIAEGKRVEAEQKRIETQKQEALTKRKGLIDTQRLSMGLTGGESYDTTKTSERGALNLTGEVLG